jgi:hypothetical protein
MSFGKDKQGYTLLFFESPPATLSLNPNNNTGGIVGTPASGAQTLYYPDLTEAIDRTLNGSIKEFFADRSSSGCDLVGQGTAQSSPVTTFSLGSLGFVPPFKLKWRSPPHPGR